MTNEHLDDETLSAHLDGEAPEAARHLAGCPQCAGRLAQLEAAAALVSAPPAPMDDEARAGALAAAMDAWRGGGEAGRPARRLWLLAVAAVAAVMLVSAVALRSIGNDHRSSLGRQAAETTAPVALDGGDLGDQSDPSALAGAVRSALGGNAAAGALTGADTAGGSAVAGRAVAPTTTTAQGPFSSGASGSGAGSTAAPAPEALASRAAPASRTVRPACASTVAKSYGAGLGPLLYTASLRWQGTPAELLAYRLAQPGRTLTIRAFVMARKDCQLLVVQSL